MSLAKRYFMALACMVAAWILLGFVTDALSFWLVPIGIHDTVQEAQAWGRRMLLVLNVLAGFQMTLTFAIGAFVLRRRAFIPAIVVWAAASAWSIHILREIALPATPEITYLDVVMYNPAGWIIGLVSVFIGVMLGEFASRGNQAAIDAL